MRKDLIALGLVITFAGLIFMAFSRVTVRPEPIRKWVSLAKYQSPQPVYNMSVQAPLTSSERFKVYFQFGPYSGGSIVEGAGVVVNVTGLDVTGQSIYAKSFDIPVKLAGGLPRITVPFPEDTVNQTGTYRANAEAFFVSIIYLDFQKLELKEAQPQYPYATLSPYGYATSAVGVAVLLIGTKVSKHRRHNRKQKG